MRVRVLLNWVCGMSKAFQWPQVWNKRKQRKIIMKNGTGYHHETKKLTVRNETYFFMAICQLIPQTSNPCFFIKTADSSALFSSSFEMAISKSPSLPPSMTGNVNVSMPSNTILSWWIIGSSMLFCSSWVAERAMTECVWAIANTLAVLNKCGTTPAQRLRKRNLNVLINSSEQLAKQIHKLTRFSFYSFRPIPHHSNHSIGRTYLMVNNGYSH